MDTDCLSYAGQIAEHWEAEMNTLLAYGLVERLS